MRSAVFVMFALLYPLCSLPSSAASAISTLDLAAAGQPRALPERILGASVETFWDHVIDDPEKVAAIKSLHPAYTRFPGGMQSNYYDWKRGLLFLQPKPDSSPGYKLMDKFANIVARGFPRGIWFEQYKAFNNTVGADMVMLPNLETASAEDQAQWFRHLAAQGVVPAHIELGNEFWIATGMDPHVIERWSDEPATMRIMHQYVDAIRPYLPKNAKIATQAAAASFQTVHDNRPEVTERLRRWDDALKPEPWFDAVSIHLYPRLSSVLGRADAVNDPMTPQIAQRNLRALMARVDEGVDSMLREVADRLPGKEIWITEWNPRGADMVTSPNQTQPTTPPMLAHLVSRMTLAFLRHPEVTVALFFSVSFPRTARHARDAPVVDSLLSSDRPMFVEGKEGYQRLPVAVALNWLNEAANGGVTFQRFREARSPRIPGGGVRQESYAAVEGGLFRAQGRATMILQNVSAEPRVYHVGKDLKLGTPSRVERLAMSDLDDPRRRAAEVEEIESSMSIPVPPYSITRIVWQFP